MAREVHNRDIGPTLVAARQWIDTCLIADGSLFSTDALWTGPNVEEVSRAFVDHPDTGSDDFLTKLKGQMTPAPTAARRLMAEMLWALLLFPSNMKAATKRQQIRELWALGGTGLHESQPLLSDEVLKGVGSGGPGFNNYRPNELEYLISLTKDLKHRASGERRRILSDYDGFVAWIESVPRKGSRQYRHMLRFLAFPELVERISSNNDRRKILKGFGAASGKEVNDWSDTQLDKALLKLRETLKLKYPSEIIDFYSPTLKPQWSKDQKIRTVDGEVTVVVPSDDEEEDEVATGDTPAEPPSDLRPSYQVQAKLAEIGAKMGFKVWLPRSDRGRIREFMSANDQLALLEELPLNNEEVQYDREDRRNLVKGSCNSSCFRSRAHHFRLFRIAANGRLTGVAAKSRHQLHIVAPAERRDKFFREMRRPVFSLLNRRPLTETCTFISYESVSAIRSIEHLAHLNDTIIREYEEQVEDG